LKNVADISSHTWSGKIDFEYYGTKGSFFQSRLTFNKYNSKVNRLHSSKSSIPLSGFNSINQSLLLDQPAGIILGTSYLRNSDGQLIIDDQGFPKVNLQKSVIGDPTPSVSLSLYQLIKYKRFSFSMLFNAQIGGDYWSGTQQSLNYFGRSLESADLRAVNNYVFPGVRADGSINSIPVAFASSESTVFDNRWTRYGYLGVGEEGIKDASYFNIASVRLSYQVYNRSQIFREWRFGVFGKNVLLLNHVSGYNYQSSLFGINTLSAIDYFNLPLPVEIGIFVEVKI